MRDNTRYLMDDKGNIYRFFQGKAKREIPKSWGKGIPIFFQELYNLYNSGIVTLYPRYMYKDTFHYSTYRDGCFHEICGRCFKINYMPTNKKILIPDRVKQSPHLISHYYR